MKNIVILISGTGSNMQAIVERSILARWPQTLDARISLVLSSNPKAKGLQWAQAHGIDSAFVDHQAYRNSPEPRQAFENDLMKLIDEHTPSLVVLAGFMRILSPLTTSRYAGRMMNIHPSLLPAFPGLNTHERALEMGCRFAGASVHWVSEALDAGQLIDQAVVPVLPDDDAQSLAKRVLSAEHRLYPRVIERWLKH